jgi:hypothetical protein
MGISSSKNNNKLNKEQIQEICINSEFNNLINKIICDKIYDKIDDNNDGIITREELNKWTENYKNSILKLKKHNKKEMNKNEQKLNEIKQKVQSLNEVLYIKNNEITELQKKIKCIQAKKEELEKNNIILLNKLDDNTIINDISNNNIQSVISTTKVDEYVSYILENNILNFEYIPDWIERPIYKNTILIILNLFDLMAKGATVNLLGHRFRLIVDGSDTNQSNNDN